MKLFKIGMTVGLTLSILLTVTGCSQDAPSEHRNESVTKNESVALSGDSKINGSNPNGITIPIRPDEMDALPIDRSVPAGNDIESNAKKLVYAITNQTNEDQKWLKENVQINYENKQADHPVLGIERSIQTNVTSAGKAVVMSVWRSTTKKEVYETPVYKQRWVVTIYPNGKIGDIQIEEELFK